MILEDIRTLPIHMADRTSLMALDLGKKTIGMAISDDERRVATSLDTILRTKFSKDADLLLTLAMEYSVGGFIIGLPVNMDGTEGPRCQSVRQFGTNFVQKTDLPIGYWDERMSTQAVERHLIAQDVTRKRRARVIDKMAAQFILQGVLDFLQKLED
tara:strand:- start:1465 stop:1935 length:471 start_codon:yes stop_codon:yes gene_type:complete